MLSPIVLKTSRAQEQTQDLSFTSSVEKELTFAQWQCPNEELGNVRDVRISYLNFNTYPELIASRVLLKTVALSMVVLSPDIEYRRKLAQKEQCH
jgi:hypothetical protein